LVCSHDGMIGGIAVGKLLGCVVFVVVVIDCVLIRFFGQHFVLQWSTTTRGGDSGCLGGLFHVN